MRVGPTLDRLLKEYPDDLRIVYKQHPLPMHSQAPIAAEAAIAARHQGKFFEMHEALLKNSRSLSKGKILEIAGQIGMDVDRLGKELDNRTHKAEVDKETREVVSLGATGTPASFINGRFLNGAQPYEAFKKLVDEELKKAKAGSS